MTELSDAGVAPPRVVHERYRVLGEIGHGGMGAVFLAEDIRLPGRECALKEIRVPQGVDPQAAQQMRDAFLGEAALLARLDHPGLPRVSDHFEQEGVSYLVMDFVPGHDLAALLDDARRRGRRLDVAQVVGWGEALCEILGYLHRQRPPVVHRDVKPANVKLTPDGQLKLVDFGLATPVGPEPEAVTVTVQAGGSRPYQPLEQYGADGEADPRSDLYALGATLYHLLSAHAPPSARERFLDPEVLRPLAELRKRVPRPVGEAIEAAMALHPDERPPTAEALRRLLVARSPSGAESHRAQPVDLPQEPWSSAWRQNLWLLALLTALLLAALAVTWVA